MATLLTLNGTERILLGPLVLSSDGITLATGLSIQASDILLSKESSTFSAKSDATSGVENGNGYYTTFLDSTDLNTSGRLVISVEVTGILPYWQEREVGAESSPIGHGLSTCYMKLGPYHSKPNLSGVSSAVSGVILDLYTGSPPAVGSGAITATTNLSGFAFVTFDPGTTRTPWYLRATYPAGTWDTEQSSYVYATTVQIS